MQNIQPPKMFELRRFALKIMSFPITGLGIVQYAEHSGYPNQLIDFVKLFSGRTVFNSRSGFLESCRLLKNLMRQEKLSLIERPREVED